jgi:dihydropteroate synthase
MHSCTVNRIKIGGGAPVRLMGVINCSPESFYSASYIPVHRVYARASEMAEQGADLIDIGARSTAPGVSSISIQEEKERITAVLRELDGSPFAISVDTMHPEVLEVALRYEIHAVNDISGLANPDFARLLADSGLPAFLMASETRPGDAIGVLETVRVLGLVLARCEAHGIRDIILDPGIGLWIPERTVGNDWEICRAFEEFGVFGYPLLAAVSRKSFIGSLLGKAPEERLYGSLAINALLIDAGASVVRSHDVAETKDVIRVCQEMRRKR